MATIGRAGHQALIVIDVQHDVVASCWDVPRIVANIAELLAAARAAGMLVIHVQHSEPDMPIGSDGWRILDDVIPAPGEAVVQKVYRDAFAGTELDALLAGAGVDALVIAGAQSDYCIRSTCQAAAVRGYDVTLATDCHTTEDFASPSVTVSAEQIIEHHNGYWRGLSYPGQRFAAVSHTELISDFSQRFARPGSPIRGH